jgi:hypothetical protein
MRLPSHLRALWAPQISRVNQAGPSMSCTKSQQEPHRQMGGMCRDELRQHRHVEDADLGFKRLVATPCDQDRITVPAIGGSC